MGSATIREIEGGGELRFRDAARQYCSLKTPTGLAGNFTLELPDADGALNEGLITNGAGKLSWAAIGALAGGGTPNYVARWTGAATLGDSLLRDDGTSLGIHTAPSANAVLNLVDSAGEANIIRMDGSLALGALLNIQQGSNEDGILVNKSAVGGGDAINITNDGTGYAIEIDNNGASDAIVIDQSGAGRGIEISQSGDEYALYIDDSGVGFLGAVYITCSNDVNVFELVKTGAGGGAALYIDNDGTGYGIYVEQDGAGYGIYVTTTSEAGIYVDQGGNFACAEFVKSGGTDYAIYIENAGSSQACRIKQTGANSALYVDQDGANYAARFDVAAGAAGGIFIANASATYALNISQSGGEDALYINQQTTNQVAYLYKSNVGGGAAVVIENDGTGYGLSVDQDGAATALRVDSDANLDTVQIVKAGIGVGDCLKIANSGTGYDIEGTTDNWHVRPGGGFKIAGLVTTEETKQISTGTITIDEDNIRIEVQSESGVTDDLYTINGGTEGQIIFLYAYGGHTITVKDWGGSTGNINLDGGTDKVLDYAAAGTYSADVLTLMFLNTKWQQVAFSANY